MFFHIFQFLFGAQTINKRVGASITKSLTLADDGIAGRQVESGSGHAEDRYIILFKVAETAAITNIQQERMTSNMNVSLLITFSPHFP